MSQALKYDFDKLPMAPFSIYCLNEDGEVQPKTMYTVTKKTINYEKKKIELYISELKRQIHYDPKYVTKVGHYCNVN